METSGLMWHIPQPGNAGNVSLMFLGIERRKSGDVGVTTGTVPIGKR